MPIASQCCRPLHRFHITKRTHRWSPHRSSSSSSTFDAPEARAQWLQRLEKHNVQDQLLRRGYYVLPSVFPVDYIRVLRDQIAQLHQHRQLYPNATHVHLSASDTTPLLLEKQHIYETELILDQLRDYVPMLKRFHDDQVMFAPLQHHLPTWLHLSHAMIKVQYNQGGNGCFPMHFDTYGSDHKCLTAVLYLNEEYDGGEMVLYPFPQQKQVVIPPRAGDVVLFSSSQMLHRVLPAKKPRYCLTTWMYSDATRDPHASAGFYHQEPPQKYVDAVLQKIVRSPFRRHLARLYYQEEWQQSLLESHRLTPAFQTYMETQAKEVQVIEHATVQMLRNFQLKCPSNEQFPIETTAQLLHAFQAKSYQVQWF